MSEIIPTGNRQVAKVQEIKEAFDQAASSNVFIEYASRKALNTQKRHLKELDNFSAFLQLFGIDADLRRPEEWTHVTFGIIEGYQRHMLQKGYSINTINQTIYILKAYARLAMKAGFIDYLQAAKIEAIAGFKPIEAKHVDEQRPITRIGRKKAENTRLTAAAEARLKKQPNTLQGLRDRLLMTILLDHGPRISEVAALTGSNFNMDEGTITFYRQKTNQIDTHYMTDDTRKAAIDYFKRVPPQPGKSIWVGTRKGYPDKQWGGFGYEAMKQRVRAIGEAAGIERLSPHDCRHYFATKAKKNGLDAIDIMRAGGWRSLVMVNRYVDQEAISFDGRTETAVKGQAR